MDRNNQLSIIFGVLAVFVFIINMWYIYNKHRYYRVDWSITYLRWVIFGVFVGLTIYYAN